MDIPKPQYYHVHLIGTRAGWPDNMTEREEQIMNEHFEYLKKLTADGKVLLAGPVIEKKIGLIVLKVYSEAEAFGAICATADKTEGTGAFLEKREAKFGGK